MEGERSFGLGCYWLNWGNIQKDEKDWDFLNREHW